MVVLPTGYGLVMENIKIFQLLPDVYDMLLGVTGSILMQDEVAKLNDQGISACIMHDTRFFCATLYYCDGSNIKLPLDRLENPSCSICTHKSVSMTRKYKLFSTVYRKPLNISPPPEYKPPMYKPTTCTNAHLIPNISPPNISPP